jgi:hypothetical protein
MDTNKMLNINVFFGKMKKLFLGLVICCIVGTTFINVSVAKHDKKNASYKDKDTINYDNINKHFTSFDLKQNSAGYTLQSVGKSQDWLEGRLSIQKYKPFASAYIDVETANQVIKEIGLENESKIKEWLDKNDSKFISLYKKFDKKIGIAVEKSQNTVGNTDTNDEFKYQDCNIGVVVLRKLYNQKKFFIVGSYPVSDDMQKADETINNNRNKKFAGFKESTMKK